MISCLHRGSQYELNKDISPKLSHGETQTKVSHGDDGPVEEHDDCDDENVSAPEQVEEAELSQLVRLVLLLLLLDPRQVDRLVVPAGGFLHDSPGLLQPAPAQQPAGGLRHEQPQGELEEAEGGHDPLEGDVVPDKEGEQTQHHLPHCVGHLYGIAQQVFIGQPRQPGNYLNK